MGQLIHCQGCRHDNRCPDHRHAGHCHPTDLQSTACSECAKIDECEDDGTCQGYVPRASAATVAFDSADICKTCKRADQNTPGGGLRFCSLQNATRSTCARYDHNHAICPEGTGAWVVKPITHSVGPTRLTTLPEAELDALRADVEAAKTMRTDAIAAINAGRYGVRREDDNGIPLNLGVQIASLIACHEERATKLKAEIERLREEMCPKPGRTCIVCTCDCRDRTDSGGCATGSVHLSKGEPPEIFSFTGTFGALRRFPQADALRVEVDRLKTERAALRSILDAKDSNRTEG